ncbi:MAG: twin-arginine translocase subunit TatC [Gemmatimonadota bacterium]|nr:twin-arginine translocase subunit TatC [Gemmatimonadota bacterium]
MKFPKRHRNERGEMPFLDHLEELRWRILWTLLAIIAGTAVGFGLVVYYDALELLMRPVRRAWEDPSLQLIYLSPADPFFVMIRLAIYIGIIVAFPILVYNIWAFLSPALDKREKRAILPALYLGLVLFIAGVALAYFAALPMTLRFFQGFMTESLEGQLEINYTLGFVVKLLFAFGAVFELPIVIVILSAMGLVTPEFLREKRRHAIVAITVLASFITPGDAITLTFMMMLPLVLLYELGIFMSAAIYRGRRKREAELEEEYRKKYEPSEEPPVGAVERKDSSEEQ